MAGNIMFIWGIDELIDAKNDKNREYPGSFVIPIVRQQIYKTQQV